jgi:trehalose 6-phosphate synthase/phosphatase
MESQQRLIVVSNRLPVKLHMVSGGWRAERSAGGLATAMTPILGRSNGIWIGWSGDTSGAVDRKREGIIERWAEREGYIAVDLPPEVARRYYEGYSNQTLWPLLHYFPSRLIFDFRGWEAYIKANRLFCDAVLKHHRPGDLIWVHDYHLMLLPRLLREALPGANVGFFLHTPFPSSEIFRIFPRREELLQGLLGADLLVFQTHSHLQHFRSTLLRVLGAESRLDQLEREGRTVRLEALPIGIAPGDFTGLLEKEEVVRHLGEVRERFRGRRILLGVDRLDYTKGIPERLRTYRRLLNMAPELRGQIVLIQVAVPSRERIPGYQRLRREVNELVGEINGHFATHDWTPVVYIGRGIARPQLVALYAAADVGWITPLRDGMNLVAKEYVTCKTDGNGVLVLSEFAGAAAEMGEAFLVNPFDEESTAEAITRALSLPEEERRLRMLALRQRVERNNVFAWSERFLSALRSAAAARVGRFSDQPLPLDVTAIVEAYRNGRKRLLFLDYDGTLASYASRPEQATPSTKVIELLSRLASDPANCVTLVSGRRQEDLERWFGNVRGLLLAAEHGALIRSSETGRWDALRSGIPDHWKCRVIPVLDHFVDRTPGSFVEEKEYSLVWHYRMSEPEFGEWLANELVAMLEGMLAETELRAIRGKKTVEIKPLWANKGEVAERLLNARRDTDFLFAAGDDRTDEDLFTRLGNDAWTIRVGAGHSHARFFLPDAASVQGLLEQFVRR